MPDEFPAHGTPCTHRLADGISFVVLRARVYIYIDRAAASNGLLERLTNEILESSSASLGHLLLCVRPPTGSEDCYQDRAARVVMAESSTVEDRRRPSIVNLVVIDPALLPGWTDPLGGVCKGHAERWLIRGAVEECAHNTATRNVKNSYYRGSVSSARIRFHSRRCLYSSYF